MYTYQWVLTAYGWQWLPVGGPAYYPYPYPFPGQVIVRPGVRFGRSLEFEPREG